MTRTRTPIRHLVTLALTVSFAACSGDKTAPATAAGTVPAGAAAVRPPSQAELVSGPLPGGPEGNLAREKCTICHTDEYLTQQRLSPEAWHKTVAKMQRFGAPLSDGEAKTLAT